jgi:hypothetical protein
MNCVSFSSLNCTANEDLRNLVVIKDWAKHTKTHGSAKGRFAEKHVHIAIKEKASHYTTEKFPEGFADEMMLSFFAFREAVLTFIDCNIKRGRVVHIQNKLALLSAEDKVVFQNHRQKSGFDFDTDPDYEARVGIRPSSVGMRSRQRNGRVCGRRASGMSRDGTCHKLLHPGAYKRKLSCLSTDV